MLVGVRLVLDGRITSGTLILFILYLGKLYKPMKNLARMTDTMSKSAVAFERIRELLEDQRRWPTPPAPGRHRGCAAASSSATSGSATAAGRRS